MDILSDRERYVTQLSLIFTKASDNPRDMTPDVDYAIRLLNHKEQVLRQTKTDPDNKTHQTIATLYTSHSADDIAPYLAHELKAVYDVTADHPLKRPNRGGVEAAKITLGLKPQI